jgi:hypothetical protein
MNRPPILPKVYAVQEELFAGQLWFSTWGVSIKPSHVHILLVGHLLKRKGFMEVSSSSPVLQAGM